jgi:tetratricopeptide (TPR) repeat protein
MNSVVKNIVWKTYIGMLLLTALACDDDYLQLEDPNSPTTETYIATKQDAVNAVNACYSVLQTAGMYGNYQLGYMSAKSDLFIGLPGKPHYSEGATYNVSSDSWIVETMWYSVYFGVWRCNQVIQRIGEMELGESGYRNPHGDVIMLQDRILAEAHFLKGLYYFMGLNVFGKIIPIDKLLATEEELFDRAFMGSRDSSFAYVEKLFLKAKDNLPVEYTSDDLGRATNGAVLAYLGKLNLYWTEYNDNRYSKAIEYFEELLGPRYSYALTTNWRDNFTEVNNNNSESIFEVQFKLLDNYQNLKEPWELTDDWRTAWDRIGEHHPQEQVFGPSGSMMNDKFHSGWHEGYPSMKLVQKFEKGDLRKKQGLFGPGDFLWDSSNVNTLADTTDPQSYAFKKWLRQNPTGDNSLRKSEINIRIMRLADVYLMYAECLMKTNRLSEAVEYINKVRERAGANNGDANFPLYDPINYTTVAQVYEILEHERAVECFFEGTRFFDLRRWDKDPDCPFDALDMIKAVHPMFEEGKHEYWPIYQDEIDSNWGVDQSDQNPGY